MGPRFRLHDDVPDRPSAKITPVECQLATMAFKIKAVTVPKRWGRTAEVVTRSGTVSASGAELHETGGRSVTLAVNRLVRRRAATRRWRLSFVPVFSSSRKDVDYGAPFVK